MTESRTAGAAADLLSLLRASSSDTTLLRACLLEDERGKAALESWSRSGLGASLLPLRLNRLFPLLAEAIRRFDIPLEPTVRSRLRAALASEDMRYEAYLKVLGPALAALAENGIAVIVLKGAALAETAYPRPQLRHSHDVDLLIAADQRANAVTTLRRTGWNAAFVAPAVATQTLVHGSGLPLSLHTRLIRGSLHPVELGTLRARAKPLSIAGVPVITLSSADTLLHILGQAVTSGSFASLLWACDAFFCVKHGDIDWDVLIAELSRTELSLTYVELLRYLHTEIEVDLPDALLGAMRSQSKAVSWRQREALVASLTAGAFGLPKMWRRAGAWRTRAAVLKWLLLPNASLADAFAPGIPRWQLPLRNLGRAAARISSRRGAAAAS